MKTLEKSEKLRQFKKAKSAKSKSTNKTAQPTTNTRNSLAIKAEEDQQIKANLLKNKPKTKSLPTQQQDKEFNNFLNNRAERKLSNQQEKVKNNKVNKKRSNFAMPLRTQNVHDNPDMVIDPGKKSADSTRDKVAKTKQTRKKINFTQVKANLEKASSTAYSSKNTSNSNVKNTNNLSKQSKKKKNNFDVGQDDRRRAYSREEELQLTQKLNKHPNSKSVAKFQEEHNHQQSENPISKILQKTQIKSNSKIGPSATPNIAKSTRDKGYTR